MSCGEVGVYEKEKTAKLLIYGNLERPVAIFKALHMRMKTAAAGRTRKLPKKERFGCEMACVTESFLVPLTLRHEFD